MRIAIATALLSLSRQQGLYVAVALFPCVMFALFGRRDGWCVRFEHGRVIARAALAVLVGSLPAIALQIYRGVVYGSPLAPSELRILGVQLAKGVPIKTHLIANGIAGSDAASLARGFVDGWLWKVEWPMGAFYHSQWFAAGFITVFVLATSPLWVRATSRTERWLFVALVAVSLLAGDFALPRWAYTLTLALAIAAGRAMSALAGSRRAQPLFWVGAAILTVQLFRPELDYAQIATGHWISPRVNVAASPWFVKGPGELHVYPDRHYKLAIIEHTRGGYTAQLFGRRLTNEVVGTVRQHELGDRCAGVRSMLERVPAALFVDDLDLTRGCDRTCVFGGPKACKLFAIAP